MFQGYKPSELYVGKISVYPVKKTALRILKTATVTVIDMISNIGGTMGLFLGFSILSGIEVVYWVVCSVLNKCKRCNGQPLII